MLHALAAHAAGTPLPYEQESTIHSRFAYSVPSLLDGGPPRYTVAQYHAALFVQAAVRGYLARFVRSKNVGQPISMARVVKFAAMQARWKRRTTQEEGLNKWRRAALTFINRSHYARTASSFYNAPPPGTPPPPGHIPLDEMGVPPPPFTPRSFAALTPRTRAAAIAGSSGMLPAAP